MMNLIRSVGSIKGTPGKWLLPDGSFLCYTIELPWLNNHPDKSCIPTGVFDVEEYQSPKHGQVWQVMNVPDRSNIEIHGANTMRDLLGCIGVGNALGIMYGLPAVLHSQDTLAHLRQTLPKSFQLTIS